MSNRISSVLAALVLATAAAFVRAEPVLSEFMADNDSTLPDQDGDYSDWIEIYNPDRTATNLAGWYLTDNAANLRKWQFPAVTLAAHSNLIVFASGKNRASATNELHTNFSLNKDGEFLALVRPDGTNTATRFAPAFPAQAEDYSYGIALPATDVVWAATGTACRVLVPTNATTTAWRGPGFDDSTWQTGAYAVGYFNANASPNYAAELGCNVGTQLYLLRNTVYLRSLFVVPDSNAVISMAFRMRYDDGYAAFINGGFIGKSSNSPAPSLLTYASAASNTHVATYYETNDFGIAVTNLASGTNVLAIHGLNANTTSSDTFLLPQLTAHVLTGEAPQTNYFATPTPGRANGGNDTLRLPQTVAFSVSSGICTANFSCVLSGEGNGQTIRYTFDGSEPSATSAAYATPLQIATTRTIRAAVFSAEGQRGLVNGVRYTFLSGGALSFTSNLPLLVLANIDPLLQGAITQQDVKVACHLHLIDRGSNGVAVLGTSTVVNGRAGVSVRGSSSAGNAKKPYAVEFRTEQDEDEKRALLGMAADSDWVLLGPYNFDRSFLHDAFMYGLSRQLGRWAPATRFVEVFLAKTNGQNVTTNDYVGLYVLEEKIKVGTGRVNIDKLDTADLSMPDVSGGYIFKIDRKDVDEFGWRTARGIPTNTLAMLVLTSQKAAELPVQQQVYLTNAVQQFEDALYSANFTNPATGYLPLIDRGAWIDHHILNVLPKNVDGLRLSGYFHKDRLEPIAAGPAWDFDRSLDSYDGRDDAYVNWNGTSDATLFFDYCWWTQLFRDPDFWQAWVDRWQEQRRSVLSDTNLFALIDALAAEMGTNAPARDYARWGLPPSAARGGSITGEVGWTKRWLTNRAAWIDAQFTPPPTLSLASGTVTAGTRVVLGGSNLWVSTAGDPRLPGGAVAPEAFAFTNALAITTTTLLSVRSLIGTNWSGPVTALYLVDEDFATAGDLAVSELAYHPLGATTGEVASVPYAQSTDFEFLEVRNVGTRRVNLFGVRLDEDRPVSATALGAVSLATGEAAIVCANATALSARYGTSVLARVAGTWADGTLDDAGERWTLRDRAGNVIESSAYGTAGIWPGRADGKGSSLEYAGPAWDAGSRSNGANWRSSTEIHGSPGWAGTGPDRRAVINELLTHTDLPYVDAIELHNPTTNALPLGGWFLCDAVAPETVADYARFRIPDGTTLAAGGYLVFDETDFNPNGLWNTNAGPAGAGEFAFDAAHGDEAWLLAGGPSGPTAFVDHMTFAAARNGETFGRWPDGEGELYPLARQTLVNSASGSSPLAKAGAVNSEPRIGPLLISEIQVCARDGNTNEFQFVEILNAGTQSQSLAYWTLRGDVDFDFPGDLTLPAGGVLVATPFATNDSATAAAFAGVYGLTNALLFSGPWRSNEHLGAAGRVVLNRADDPPAEEPDLHPQILEEEVTYANVPPWPVSASPGRSLTRLGTGSVSRLASSWIAEVPTPGQIGLTYLRWRALYFPTGGVDAALFADADGDGDVNLAEYALGEDPWLASGAAGAGVQELAGAPWYVLWVPDNRRDATVQFEQSQDMTTWSNAAHAVLGTGSGFETRALSLRPPDPDHLYLRIRITTTP